MRYFSLLATICFASCFISLAQAASLSDGASMSNQTSNTSSVVFDKYRTRLTLAQSNPANSDAEYNWLFLPGGPGVDSSFYNELIELLHLPGNVWLIDLPENGSNTTREKHLETYDFNAWEECLKHAIQAFDKAILVGHSFSGIYPLLFPEIEKNLTGLVILNSASRLWIDAAVRVGKNKNLPSFEKELTEFLAHKSPETFAKVLGIVVHYYFSPEFLEKGTEMLLRSSWNYHAINWWLSKAPSIDFDQILIPRIPTLVIGTSEDNAVPFDGYLEDTRFQRPNVILREIEGGSHICWFEKPTEVKELFNEFIALLKTTHEQNDSR